MTTTFVTKEMTLIDILRRLERLNVIVTGIAYAETCCGQPRDSGGRCTYRPSHPIYLPINHLIYPEYS